MILVAAAVASVALATFQGTTIAWKPKVGEVTKYKLTTTSNIQGNEMSFAAILTSKVLEIKADGTIIVEEKQSDINVRFGEQDFSSMMPPSVTSTATMKADGEVVERKSEIEEGANPRMEAAMEFRYPGKPLEKGGTWTVSRLADSAKKIPASDVTYTYVDDEKVGKFDTWKITFSFKEKDGSAPMSADGTIWLNQSNGEPVKGTFKMKNVEFQEGMGVSDAAAEVNRID